MARKDTALPSPDDAEFSVRGRVGRGDHALIGDDHPARALPLHPLDPARARQGRRPPNRASLRSGRRSGRYRSGRRARHSRAGPASTGRSSRSAPSRRWGRISASAARAWRATASPAAQAISRVCPGGRRLGLARGVSWSTRSPSLSSFAPCSRSSLSTRCDSCAIAALSSREVAVAVFMSPTERRDLGELVAALCGLDRLNRALSAETAPPSFAFSSALSARNRLPMVVDGDERRGPRRWRRAQGRRPRRSSGGPSAPRRLRERPRRCFPRRPAERPSAARLPARGQGPRWGRTALSPTGARRRMEASSGFGKVPVFSHPRGCRVSDVLVAHMRSPAIHGFVL